MKKIFYSVAFILFSISIGGTNLFAQEITTCDSINDNLTSKFRFLGQWDANGTPNYLEPESDSVSQSLINYVKETLPEGVKISESNESYFGDDVQLNTELKTTSEVFLTMVHEGAGWKNTLGFYTYDVNNPPLTVYDIDSLVLIFPNVSQPNSIKPGDKVKLGSFSANTGIGYFLIAKGWKDNSICMNSHIVFSDSRFNTFTTEEFRQQTILLNYVQENKLLLGFEDIKRPGGDNDFNDAVFFVTAEPGAIDTTDIPIIPTAFISGDTTLCDENAPAIINIKLSGQAPWTIVYDNGVEEIEINGIENSDFSFQTTIKDTIKLISTKDKNNFGIISGEAIIELSRPTAIINDHSNGCGDNAAVIEIGLTGYGPWEVGYIIDGESKSIISDDNQLIIGINKSGLFELTQVEDVNCISIVEGSIDITIYETPVATIGGDATLCNNDEATIQIKLIGTAPFTFVYSDGENESTVTTNDNLFEVTTSEFKTYTILSLEDAHCSGDVVGSATISDGTKGLQVDIIANEKNCFGTEVQLGLSGNTEGLIISWGTEGNGTILNGDQIDASYIPANGEIGIIKFIAEVTNGCAVSTITKEATIIEKLDASFNVSQIKNLLTNTQIFFTPSVNSYDEYEWNFGDGNNSSAMNSSTDYVNGGRFNIELIVKESGCENTESLEIEVLSKDELYVPNVFSPIAQNPENQVVKVYGNNIDEFDFSFQIVNRWGKTMYQTKSFHEANNIGWVGINKNNNEEQELNVYTYILRGKFIGGDRFEKTGTITQLK